MAQEGWHTITAVATCLVVHCMEVALDPPCTAVAPTGATHPLGVTPQGATLLGDTPPVATVQAWVRATAPGPAPLAVLPALEK